MLHLFKIVSIELGPRYHRPIHLNLIQPLHPDRLSMPGLHHLKADRLSMPGLQILKPDRLSIRGLQHRDRHLK